MPVQLHTSAFSHYTRSDGLIFIYRDHYSNCFPLYRANTLSNHTFKLGAASEFLKSLLSIRVKLDYVALANFFCDRLEETNFRKEELETMHATCLKEIREATHRNDLYSMKLFSQKLATLSDLIRVKTLLANPTDS